MRPDFDKLLVERPRRGGKYARKGRSIEYEDMPSKEGMKRPYGWNLKEQSEYLAPLYRYLRKQIGRKWDDVYSEIRQMIGKNPNAVQGHILQHLYGFWGIELHTFELDGKRFDKTASKTYFNSSAKYQELDNDQLYVDDNGFIRNYKRKKLDRRSYSEIQKEEWMKTHRNLSDSRQAIKTNGIWYVIEMKPIHDSQIYTSSYTGTLFGKPYTRTYQTVQVNDVLGVRGSPRHFEIAYGSRVYAACKKTMSHNELKQYGLTND